MIAIPLKDGTDYQPDNHFLQELRLIYEDIDLEFQFKKMRIWCLSNPSRKKTRRGVKRFINNWLSNIHETHSRPRLSKSEHAANAIFGTRGAHDSMDLGQDGGQVRSSLDERDSGRTHQRDQTGGMGGSVIEVRGGGYQAGSGWVDGEVSPQYSGAGRAIEAYEEGTSEIQRLAKTKVRQGGQ